MIRVALSMRMMSTPHEWRDAVSTDWPRVLAAQDLLPVLVPNHADTCARYLDGVGALILSGGEDVILPPPAAEATACPEVRDRVEFSLLETALERDLPVLGVCRGLQLMNLHFGGTLRDVDDPADHVGTHHRVRIEHGHRWDPLFPVSDLEVNSFHTRALADVGSELRTLAVCDDGSVEAVYHRDRKLLGVMWHPEREFLGSEATKFHHDFVRRFIEVAG